MNFVIDKKPLRVALGTLIASAAIFCTVSSADAAAIVTDANIDFSTAPTTIDFGGGAATYTFNYLGYDGSSYTVDSVSTGGTALVNSSTFPGPGPQPIAFESGTPIGANGYNDFTAFPGGAGIAYSIADDFIGLEFTLADGDHFGYAELLGSTLVRYGYESVAGASIETGAAGTPVPEPITLSLFAAGLASAAAVRRRNRKNAA